MARFRTRNVGSSRISILRVTSPTIRYACDAGAQGLTRDASPLFCQPTLFCFASRTRALCPLSHSPSPDARGQHAGHTRLLSYLLARRRSLPRAGAWPAEPSEPSGREHTASASHLLNSAITVTRPPTISHLRRASQMMATWQNTSLLTALFLTITVPAAFEPPPIEGIWLFLFYLFDLTALIFQTSASSRPRTRPGARRARARPSSLQF